MQNVKELKAQKNIEGLIEAAGHEVDFFDTPVHPLQREAIDALLDIGVAEVMQPLLAAVKDQGNTSSVRAGAAYALGDIGDPGAVEPLIGIVEDRKNAPDLRAAAVTALGEIGDPRAADLLYAATEDEQIEVKMVASGALVNIGFVQATEAFIHGLKLKGKHSEAVDGLRQAGKHAIRSVIAALGDEDDLVRAGSIMALARMGRKAKEPLVVAIRRDGGGDMDKLVAKAFSVPAETMANGIGAARAERWYTRRMYRGKQVPPASQMAMVNAVNALARAIEPAMVALIAVVKGRWRSVEWATRKALREIDL
jgi:HEAT repeat protein